MNRDEAVQYAVKVLLLSSFYISARQTMSTTAPSLEIKARKGHQEKIIKGIYHRTRSTFGQDIDEQYIACGISHALQYPELSFTDAINLGMTAIKLMMGCSFEQSIAVIN